MQFGHDVEVHAIYAYNKGHWHEEYGNNGQCPHNFVRMVGLYIEIDGQQLCRIFTDIAVQGIGTGEEVS